MPMADTTRTVIGPVSAFALAKEAGYAGDSEQWAREQAVAATVLAQIIAGVHTDNRLMNADFTQFVAQGGLCRVHASGKVTFAGDRWELASGTLTAAENENGCGYSEVTLNGSICQRAERPPENPCCGVFVLSGTASASYADGVMTITGENAVLDCAYLYDYAGDVGDTPVRPVRRGYAAELLDCMRHYIYIPSAGEMSLVGYVFNMSDTTAVTRVTMPLPVCMRLSAPTLGYYYRTSSSVMPFGITPTSISSAKNTGHLQTLEVQIPTDGVSANGIVVLKPNAIIELSCDDLC